MTSSGRSQKHKTAEDEKVFSSLFRRSQKSLGVQLSRERNVAEEGCWQVTDENSSTSGRLFGASIQLLMVNHGAVQSEFGPRLPSVTWTANAAGSAALAGPRSCVFFFEGEHPLAHAGVHTRRYNQAWMCAGTHSPLCTHTNTNPL